MEVTIPDVSRLAWLKSEAESKASERAAEAAAAASTPLGNNADFASPCPDIHAVLPPPATVKAFYLRSIGRDLLKSQGIERRMRWCGSRISKREKGVEVWARPDRAYGRVAGVCVCGQSICCPVCAPRIASFRGELVAAAYQRALENGWDVSLETFTKPHSMDYRPNALGSEFIEFAGLWRKFQSGKKAHRRSKGSRGHFLAREINWGEVNGWHYHHHRLRFDLPGSYEALIEQADWLAVLIGAGYEETDGLWQHAFRADGVGSEAGARYVSKLATSVEAEARAKGLGSEMASQVTKGRNINSLLFDFARGDQAAGNQWVNGVACVTAGKVASTRSSRGLLYSLGLEKREKTDEQIAQDEVLNTDIYLGELTAAQWRGVLRWKAEFALNVAANQGKESVNEFLAGLSLGQLDDAPSGAVETSTKEDKKLVCSLLSKLSK